MCETVLERHKAMVNLRRLSVYDSEGIVLRLRFLNNENEAGRTDAKTQQCAWLCGWLMESCRGGNRCSVSKEYVAYIIHILGRGCFHEPHVLGRIRLPALLPCRTSRIGVRNSSSRDLTSN